MPADLPPPALHAGFEAARAPTHQARVADAAGQTQFIAFLDSHHSAIGIRKLCSDEQTIAGLQQAGVKHMFAEGIYPQLMPLIDLYVNDKISKDTLTSTLKNGFFSQYGAAGVSTNDATAMTVDLIDNCKKHGLKIHSFDHQDSLFTRAEYPGFRDYYSGLYASMAQTIERNPQVNNFPPDQLKNVYAQIEAAYRKANPEKFEALKTSMAARQERLSMLQKDIEKNPDLRAEIAKSLREKGGLTHSKYEDIISGKVDADIVKILMSGHQAMMRTQADPETAKRILNDAGNDRAAIIHGANHLYRETGDVDFYIGEDKVTSVEIVSPRQAAPNRANALEDKDMPQYRVDIDNGTWTARDGESVKVEMPAGFGNSVTPAPAVAPQPTPRVP